MLSRRHFLKKMLVFISVATGGGALLNQAIKDEEGKTSSEGALNAGGTPTPSTATPEPTPTPVEIPKELLLSFFLLSDMHISAGVEAMTEKLHYALKDITTVDLPIDTIIFGGDLTDMAREVDYRLLRNILDEYKLPPLYANMGNHDYYDIWIDKNGAFSTETVPNGKTDAMARERFMKFFGYDKPFKDVWIGDTHLILLSQEAYAQEKPEVGEGAWYSDEQMTWLTETMKQHDGGKPAFVFIHQPLPAPGSDGGSHRLVRAKEFRAILEPYKNVFVLSGHTHRSFTSENHYNTENSFHWFNNASVGRTRSATNSKSAQGMYVQVYTNEVVIRGREFSDGTWIDSALWTVPLI
jgi:Icc protein